MPQPAPATLALHNAAAVEHALQRARRSATVLLDGEHGAMGTPLTLTLSAVHEQRCSIEATVALVEADSRGRPRTLVKLAPAELERALQFLTSVLNESEPTTQGGLMLGADDDLGPAPAAPLPEGTVVGGRFRIEAFLATGGMGEVYRAVHVHLKRTVALKMVLREFSQDDAVRARFLREAQLLSQLESPHLVRVFDFGQSDEGRLFLAMELVEGRPLDHVLRVEKNLAPARAVEILMQLCAGLDEAHSQGVVHRDLKPGNIMLGHRRDGTELARIIDFGIARPLGDAKASTLTAVGVIVGTPAYMSPEQVRGEQLDARADLYSLGCVAWRLLCGRPPFMADSMVRVVAMHLTERTPAPESLNPELVAWPALCQVLLRALAKKPEDRFQTARVFSKALEAALDARNAPVESAFADWPVEARLPEPVREEEPEWPPPEPAPAPTGPADDFFGMKVTDELLPKKGDD